MTKTKKNKRKVSKNNHQGSGQSALKDITEDRSLENREISDAISKIINSSVNEPLRGRDNETGMEKCSSEALEELCAKDIMQREICWCSLETSVKQAMEEFDRYQCSYIAVGENNNLHGFLSRKDLLEAKSPYLRPEFAKWRRPIDYASLKIKIKWLIKNKSYEIVNSGDCLKNIMQKMLWTKSRCVAVIDKFEKFVGIITMEDIFDNLLAYKQRVYDEQRTANVKKAANNKRIIKAVAELVK
ncbi:MAG: CBS domain-containing protein [Planctomycetes bacterium]|nr:CBS domain-containing protein [Planctomycetota bacterium]